MFGKRNTVSGEQTSRQSRAQANDDEGSDFDTMEDDLFRDRRGKAKSTSKFEFPEPIYKDTINIGNVSGQTRHERIMSQLKIQPEEYIYWTSKDKIKVNIPDALYKPEGAARSSLKPPKEGTPHVETT